ncbi:FxSxx-COOH system tetratricopeptide repeat protein [Actinocrinis sp.]|uniref:FxSxx-COOH system tetratricopeptide repeat protein n=1 Tax=Actinocrinis sp. TaxID=1920516 RepID=UPI002C156047|nr:FxSxx-COOH system tetratricopeptide repeat protein [Actinocrinis sp.]HXR70565.1 FxSxx-COOH system tetratricopeptide repeat protein [Actinocrinis sp.]
MTGPRDGKIVTFYSYKGGTGRTMALANAAWILASAGKRVLAVDWDLESPGLHRFFHPFLDLSAVADTPGVIDMIRQYRFATTVEKPGRPLDWHREYARVGENTVSLEWEFPHGGVLHFMSAGSQNQDYSATLAGIDWDEFYEKRGGGEFFDAMRDEMTGNYDYTLIDSRTGLSDVAEICTLHFPHILVTCFTLSEQGIEGSATVAQHIDTQYASRGIRILPVPTRIDEGEKEKADAGRALARNRFVSMPRGMNDAERTQYWGSVEVPYRPFYAYEETLATFGDRPGLQNSLLSTFERLVGYITEGEVTSSEPVPEPERQRVLAAFTRRRPPHPGDIVLSYVPEDRMWAEWVSALLERAGMQTVQFDADSLAQSPATMAALSRNRTLAIVSESYLSSRNAMAFVRAVADTDPSRSRGQLIALNVAEVRSAEPFTGRPALELGGLSAAAATEAVLRAFDLPAPTGVADPTRPAPRFPGAAPLIWNVGPRNATFTGRNPVLEHLRSQLASKSVSVVLPVALHGLGGVGKTQVALEYTHRFKADYDLIWWLDAEQPGLINQSLAELARRLGIRVGESEAEAAREALDRLRIGGSPYQRWLLVFDNADDPNDLRPYLPAGSGHTLITSRNQSWTQVAEPLEIDVFAREESVAHLSRRIPSLSVADADRVAEVLGDLPLAVEVASAWLSETGTSVEDYLDSLEQESTRILSLGQPAGYPRNLEATWKISLDRLAERSKAGQRLLYMCAFLAPNISLDLIYGQQTVDALVPLDGSLRVPMMLGRVTQEVNRLALARIDAQKNELQIHRLMQAYLKNQLEPAERNDTVHLVHRILAAARPPRGDTDDPKNWEQYALIWPHLTPSEAVACDEEPVRQLLIDWVRYQWKSGAFDSALELAQTLDTAWSAALAGQTTQAPGDEAQDLLRRQLLHLRFHIGNIYRSQGKFQQAREMNQSVRAEQEAALPPNDLHTLMTAGGLAADLRGLGQFAEALRMDEDTYNSLKEIFGEDHERTLSAANNLAVSCRLVGDNVRARDLDRDTLRRRRTVLGPKHPYTLFSVTALARDLRELGEYDESISLLESAYEDYRAELDESFQETLRTATSLAISLREAGQHPKARELTEQTLALYAKEFDTETPDALACKINLAADQAATGNAVAAAQTTAETLVAYEARLGVEHPYSHVCRNNMAVYLLRAGRVQDAEDTIRHAHTGFLSRFVKDHPYVLSAAVNLANCLVARGEFAEAARLDQETYEGFVNRLGEIHPDTMATGLNLSLDLDAVGQSARARSMREQLLPALAAKLGDDHPTVVTARRRERTDRELEPQPT